jgi:hypothetical protein
MRYAHLLIISNTPLTLVEETGFAAVKRLDDAFYPPVLIGTKRYKIVLRIFLSIFRRLLLG